jgi:hypothetical protein
MPGPGPPPTDIDGTPWKWDDDAGLWRSPDALSARKPEGLSKAQRWGTIKKKSEWLGSFNVREAAVHPATPARPAMLVWQGGANMGSVKLDDTASVRLVENERLVVRRGRREVQFAAASDGPSLLEWRTRVSSAMRAAASGGDASADEPPASTIAHEAQAMSLLDRFRQLLAWFAAAAILAVHSRRMRVLLSSARAPSSTDAGIAAAVMTVAGALLWALISSEGSR